VQASAQAADDQRVAGAELIVGNAKADCGKTGSNQEDADGKQKGSHRGFFS
jgi:hypothetical protein